MGSKLYVGNLSFQTTESTLRDVFSEGGRTVKSVEILIGRKGKSRGFAFVEMGDEEEALSAKEALEGSDVDGRAIHVGDAREGRARASFGSGGFRSGGRGRGEQR